MFLPIRWLWVTFTTVQNQVDGCQRFGKPKTAMLISNGRDVTTKLSCNSKLPKETWCLSMFCCNMMVCYDFYGCWRSNGQVRKIMMSLTKATLPCMTYCHAHHENYQVCNIVCRWPMQRMSNPRPQNVAAKEQNLSLDRGSTTNLVVNKQIERRKTPREYQSESGEI